MQYVLNIEWSAEVAFCVIHIDARVSYYHGNLLLSLLSLPALRQPEDEYPGVPWSTGLLMACCAS